MKPIPFSGGWSGGTKLPIVAGNLAIASMKLPIITASERNLSAPGSATILLDSEHRQIADCTWPEDAQSIKKALNSHASLVAENKRLRAALDDIEATLVMDPDSVRSCRQLARAALNPEGTT